MNEGMTTVRTIAAAREALAHAPRPVGLVPTMGALHDGHLALLGRAREACATVVMSLFVNPTQFGEREDLAGYPRDERRDGELASAGGVDLLFAPSVAEMYPAGFATTIAVSGLSEPLEGEARGPEHFHAVATVVVKLLNIVTPQVAYFGQKDAQQVDVVRRMVRDLDVPVKIVVVPTVRAPDGVALSSRNVYLSAEQRRIAVIFARAVQAAAISPRPVAQLKAALKKITALRVDYVEQVDERLCAAVFVGKTRLIDNARVPA